MPPHRHGSIVPFVIEASGSFGHRANELVKRLVHLIPDPDLDPSMKPAPAPPMMHDKGFHARLTGRLKERATAAIHRHNSSIVAAFRSTVGKPGRRAVA